MDAILTLLIVFWIVKSIGKSVSRQKKTGQKKVDSRRANGPAGAAAGRFRRGPARFACCTGHADNLYDAAVGRPACCAACVYRQPWGRFYRGTGYLRPHFGP